MMTYIVYRKSTRDDCPPEKWIPVYLTEAESPVEVLQNAIDDGVTCTNDQQLMGTPAEYASKADVKAAQLATEKVKAEQSALKGTDR